MRVLIILSLACAAALAAPVEEVDPAIVGGVNAIPGEFPYIVSLQWVILGVSSHVCGGSIIGPLWILTAAHCLTEIPSLGRITVHSGRHNLASAEPTQVISEIERDRSFIHPDWTPGGQVGPDDLALLRLAVPLVFNDRIRAVRIPQPHVVPVGPATLSGWGSTGGTLPATILQKVTKPLIEIEVCRNAFFSLGLNGALVDYTNVCTGPLTGGVSACRFVKFHYFYTRYNN